MHKKNPINFIPTLDASTYSDQTYYQRELNTIFYHEWIYVLHESQIPARVVIYQLCSLSTIC